jgi:alkanesulfonate monooxygenase SsuD/methylene tetrahydromethanopterin reductase-like flavin-dependent oxidoreductase (luciferase family)
MKFGLGLSVQHSPEDSQAGRFQEHLEQVRLAAAVDFDSVWASQHYLSAPFSYFQPIPVLAKPSRATDSCWEIPPASGRRSRDTASGSAWRT